MEDDADIRDIARFALEGEGLGSMLCASVVEAIDKATDFCPHLKLPDVMMAGKEHATVIFLTTKVQQDEPDELKSLGAIDVIRKPIDPMALRADADDWGWMS